MLPSREDTMTDYAPATSTIRRSRGPRPGIPLRIGASLAAMSILLGDALSMAYVNPSACRPRSRTIADDDIDGRDPNW